jgi:hypothetical protein
MKNIYLVVIVGLLYSTSLFSQIKKVTQLNEEINLYEKVEWRLDLMGKWSNPYNQEEVTLDMHFTTPSGKKGVLPCYYVSGNSGELSSWAARFAPSEVGNYKLIFSFKNSDGIISYSKKQSFTAKPSSKMGFLRTNNNWTFKTDNGALFRGIGENICWESRDVDDSKYFKELHEDPRFNYDFMIKKLAANGGNFFRTWMIYWNLPVDWKQVQNNKRYSNSSLSYNSSGMERLDHVVALCDSLGVYMMLALESHVGLMGSGWETSNYNIKNGGFAATPAAFFALPEARKQFKNKLRLMVARYGYSTSIGAWEFFNEVDNAMYQGKSEEYISQAVVTDWHREMSDYLKSIDPYNHLVTTSISHREIEGLNEIPSIDFNQKHIYCNTLGIPDVITSQTAKFNKPYVIGESGYHWDWSIDFNKYATEFDHDFKLGLWLGLFSPTPVLPMSWWWEFFENRGLMSYFETIQSVNKEMLDDTNGDFNSLTVTSANEKVKCFVINGKAKHFLLVVNSTSDKQISSIQFSKSNKLIQKAIEVNTNDNSRKLFNSFSFSDGDIMLPDLELKANEFRVFIFN